jgi:hypothetical protein
MKPNIIMVFAFHNMGGMWLRGPATQDESLDPKDVALYDYLGENAEKMTPGYRYMPSWQLYPTFGDFGEFTYNLLGAYSFIGELFHEQPGILPERYHQAIGRSQRHQPGADEIQRSPRSG